MPRMKAGLIFVRIALNARRTEALWAQQAASPALPRISQFNTDAIR